MAITWTEDADSRRNLGDSSIQQVNTAAFGVSDYVLGGYSVVPGSFGMSHIRGLIPIAYTGNTGSVTWAYQKPAVAGPAASNPGFLKAYGDGGPTVGAVATEVSASSNFTGVVDFLADGW